MVPGCYRCNNHPMWTITGATSNGHGDWIYNSNDSYTSAHTVINLGWLRRQQNIKKMHDLIHSVKVVSVAPLRTLYVSPLPLPVLCRWLK